MGKTLLLLEGGGYRGIFLAGVLDAFMKNGIYFDEVAGISAGSLCGYNYVSKDFERNKNILLTYGHDKRYFSMANFIKTGSAFGSSFVLEELKETIPFNEDEFLKGAKFLVGATNCNTGKCEYFSKDNKSFIDCITASASLPIISEMVFIDDIPYLDGAISEHVPLSIMNSGNYDYVVCVLTRPLGFRKDINDTSLNKFYEVRYKNYPNLVERLINEAKYYNEEREIIEELGKNKKILLIAPDERFKVSRVEMNMDNLKNGYNLGMEEGLKYISEIKNAIL